MSAHSQGQPETVWFFHTIKAYSLKKALINVTINIYTIYLEAKLKILSFLFITGAIAAPLLLHAQQAKQNLLILPLADHSDTQTYSASSIDATRELVFSSLYNFIGILPFVNIPQAGELFGIDTKVSGIASIAKKFKSDYIIYGELRLEGDASLPEAHIILRLWSRAEQKDIFERKYTSTTDLDIFDVMDRLIIDSIQAGFKIIPRFAVVNFNDFKIRDDSYTILVNNKAIAKVQTTDFNKSMKVLAGQDYNYMIIRDRDQAIMMNLHSNLKENSVQNISYEALAQVTIQKIKGKPSEQYTILFNGKQVAEGTTLTNLDVTKEHSLLVTDSRNRIFDKQNFMLMDSEEKVIRPGKVRVDSAVRLFAGGNSYGGLGFDLVFNKNLWIGLEGSYIFYNTQISNLSVSIIQAHLDMGYHFLHLSGLRLGAGLGGGYYFTTPLAHWQAISADPGSGIDLRIYAQAEWLLFYGRAGISYNLAQNAPGAYVSLGFKF